METIFRMPPDESPIDICGLINFQRSQQMSPPEIRETVRALSWTAQMRKVIHETEI